MEEENHHFFPPGREIPNDDISLSLSLVAQFASLSARVCAPVAKMRFSLAASSSSSSPAVATSHPLVGARVAALTSMPVSPSPTLPRRNRRALRPVRASASDDDSRTGSGASTTTTTATVVAVEERPTPKQQEAEKATSQASLSSPKASPSSTKKSNKGFFGLGDLLGPIGLTIGGSTKKDKVWNYRKGQRETELGSVC